MTIEGNRAWGYDRRKNLDVSRKATIRSAGRGEIPWAYASGSYREFPVRRSSYRDFADSPMGVLLQRHKDFGTSFVEDLVGVETILYDNIAARLREKKKTGRKDPVLAVDFGGMFGASWCRLAANFENEIKAGELSLIVTNLALDLPEWGSVQGLYSENQRALPISKGDAEVIDRYRHLVTYISADAEEVMQRFGGKVDILHEDNAIMHSVIPEEDMQFLASALRNDGVLMMGSMEPETHSYEDIPQMPQLVKSAFTQGLMALAALELHNVQSLRGIYRIFTRFPEGFKGADFSNVVPISEVTF